MNRRVMFLSLVLIAFAESVQSQEAGFKRDLLVGSWKVDWEKSKLESEAVTSNLPSIFRQYEDHEDGFMMHTLIMVDAAQRHAQALIAVVRYDGQEYPTYAGEVWQIAF